MVTNEVDINQLVDVVKQTLKKRINQPTSKLKKEEILEYIKSTGYINISNDKAIFSDKLLTMTNKKIELTYLEKLTVNYLNENHNCSYSDIKKLMFDNGYNESILNHVVFYSPLVSRVKSKDTNEYIFNRIGINKQPSNTKKVSLK